MKIQNFLNGGNFRSRELQNEDQIIDDEFEELEDDEFDFDDD